MSAPKTFPPYRLEGEGGSGVWIVDCHGNDVVVRVDLSPHYDDIYGERIMQLICDALNRDVTQPDPLADHPQIPKP